MLACKQSHSLPIGINWMKNIRVGPIGIFPEIKQHYLPLLCMQCERPACMEICPTGAFYKTYNGIVLIEAQKCNGCAACLTACPYNAISLDASSNIASKCNFCFERLKEGLEPVCVQTCMGRALIFGDISDSEGPVSGLTGNRPDSTLFPEYRLNPSIYYINLPDYSSGWLKSFSGGKS